MEVAHALVEGAVEQGRVVDEETVEEEDHELPVGVAEGVVFVPDETARADDVRA